MPCSRKNAQHSVHPTGGTRRVFRQVSRLEVGSDKAALSRPAHPRVTHAVGRLRANDADIGTLMKMSEKRSGKMSSEKAKASAQYNDLKGTVAADWRDNTNRLNDFAQSQAIDLQGYIPVGISVYLGEPRGSELDTASISIFAVDPIRIGRDVDEIRDSVEINEGILPCKIFRLEVPLPELLKFFKRFSIKMFSRSVGEILELQYE